MWAHVGIFVSELMKLRPKNLYLNNVFLITISFCVCVCVFFLKKKKIKDLLLALPDSNVFLVSSFYCIYLL